VRTAWTSARWSVPLPEGHRFPMAEYTMITEGLVAGMVEQLHACYA
jgi:hypothetical protein